MWNKLLNTSTELTTKEEVFNKAVKLIDDRLLQLGIVQLKPFNTFWNKTKYFEEPVWINWIYFEEEDNVWISLSWQKDLRLILHELLHANSSPNRDWISINNYYTKWDSDDIFIIKKILDEWTTELLARDIYNKSNTIIKKDEIDEINLKIKLIRDSTALKINKIRNNNFEEYNEYQKVFKNSDKKYIKEVLENHYEEEKNLKVGKTYTSYDDYVIIIKSIINNLAERNWITIDEVWNIWQINYFNRDIKSMLEDVYKSWFRDNRTSFNIWDDLEKYLK